ncbi:MAG: YbaN family protein [Candidatus Cloacimonetes bacterium]|nr:YbaN family protein [Candidatus Cloacimonadota bacterium]
MSINDKQPFVTTQKSIVTRKLKNSGKKVQRIIFITIGLISLTLGVVGIILPLLPTTPFLLLSAALFANASPKLYNWLHTNPIFGEYLRRYRNKEGIPLELKIGVLSVLWITLASSAFLAVSPERWYVRIVLLLIGLGVTIHILKIKTQEKQKESREVVTE